MNMQTRIPSADATPIFKDTQMPHMSLKQCATCEMHKVCLAKIVDDDSKEALSAFIKHHKPVHKGDHIYRQNDDFVSLYVVRSGAVKTYYITEKGDENITGLYLPGELFGIDGLVNEKHKYAAQALDTSAVCEFIYSNLELSFLSHPDIQRRLMEIVSSEIYDRQQALTQHKNSAEERLATFLTSVSDRMELRGLSPIEINLPMSRRDIATYLGVAGETMSRLFTRFQNKGLLSITGRSVFINDLPALQDMSVTIH